MVDRATHYQNAMNQIQERNNKQVHNFEIPDNTQERHVKAVRLFIVSPSQVMTFLA
jgi:hypothetical protein